MFLLLWFGGNFGASGNLRILCAAGGAGKWSSFFDYDWRQQLWNIVFILSAIVGGYLAVTFLPSPEALTVSAGTEAHLNNLNITMPSSGEGPYSLVPAEIFDLNNLFTLKNIIILIGGGFLIGFGTRYAGGCTSGHAISGLSNLQWPSLIAVIGFFIGGLLMTWVIFPFIYSL